MQIRERRIARRAIITAVALLAPALVRAQATAGTRLGDLYAEVMRVNPKLGAANALVRAAEVRVPGAKRPPDPQLQLGFMNYSLPGLSPMAPIGMTQIQVMQMLPLGGKLTLAGRSASAQADAAAARAEDVAWSLRSETAMAFYDLYAADRQLAIARETLGLLRDVAKTAESMYRVGDGRQADVLRANVEIARMADDTLRMLAMRRTMQSRLDALLTRDASMEIVSPALPVFPDSILAEPSLDSAALAGRAMIRAGLADVRAADASAALARKELIPDLQLGIQYGQRGTTMDGVTKTERMGSLMIGASIPIFARDRQLAMRSESEAMRLMAESDVAAMRAETRGKVGEAYAALVRARDLQRLYRTTVLPQAEATVQSALAAYRAGQVDFMTLLDDRMAVNRYRGELAALEADEGKAWADLEMLTGRELIDANAVRPTVAGTGELK